VLSPIAFSSSIPFIRLLAFPIAIVTASRQLPFQFSSGSPFPLPTPVSASTPAHHRSLARSGSASPYLATIEQIFAEILNLEPHLS
jgi:hypothetical protein